MPVTSATPSCDLRDFLRVVTFLRVFMAESPAASARTLRFQAVRMTGSFRMMRRSGSKGSHKESEVLRSCGITEC